MWKMIFSLAVLSFFCVSCGNGQGKTEQSQPVQDAAPEVEPQGCTPGDKKCSGNVAQICDQDRIWQEVETCPYVCDNGECVGECNPGDKRCDELIPQLCNQQNLWESQTPCEFQCVNGECAGECEPGDKKCSGQVAQLCDENRIWQDTETCPYQCVDGSCLGECDPGDKQCDGLIPQLCNQQYTWENQTTCQFQCLNGECVGECTPGDKKCSGNVAQICDQDRIWQEVETCPYVCDNGECVGECNPGDKRCDELIPQLCNQQNLWENQTPCEFQCLNGECVGECTPGDKKCSGNVAQTCNTNYLWQNDPCASGSCTCCNGSNLAAATLVTTGKDNTCSLMSDGSIWCWGNNQYGQTNATSCIGQYHTPLELVALGKDNKHLAAGYKSTCALKTNGTVWCWGDNTCTPNSLDTLGTNVKELSMSINHACALKTDGTLWCWGNNGTGAVTANGTYSDSNLPPTQVSAFGNQIKQISVGLNHTCALKTDGTLWCWGLNLHGQVGDGTMNYESETCAGGYKVCRLSPVQITSISNNGLQVAAGTFNTCVLKKDGTVWCWGLNDEGQLGDGTTTGLGCGYSNSHVCKPSPVQVTNLGTEAASIATSSTSTGSSASMLVDMGHYCASKQNGTMWCWGANYYGQLGDNTNTTQSNPVPVSLLAQIKNMSLGGGNYDYGGGHTCAIALDNTLWCWGSNYYGMVGDGSIDSHNTPVQIIPGCN